MSSAEPAAAEPAAPKSRAGRNLPAAIAVGVALGAIIIATLVWYKYLFAVLVTVAMVIAVWELYNAFLHNEIKIARTPLYVVAIVGPTLAYLYGVTAHLAIFGAFVVVALMWRIRRGTEGFVADATGSLFVGFYLLFMVGFVMLMLREPDGVTRIVAFVAITICNDIGGYAAGVLFGKHPIAPQVSPKKSWEGFAGSVALQVAVAIPIFIIGFDEQWWKGVIFGVVMSITATAGDFIESAVKRDLDVKDMSNILPGHGGLMDRLDSLIPNAFVAWALLTWLVGG
ncbi:MAG: phosphatidate cytidylyltransferase [Candidatus Nanopelagicales bacterium]